MAKPRQKYFSSVIKPEDGSRITEEFRDIYELRNRLETVTTNPDGSRTGLEGDMLRLESGGSVYLEICSGGTVWLGVVLTNTP